MCQGDLNLVYVREDVNQGAGQIDWSQVTEDNENSTKESIFMLLDIIL